MTTTETDPQTTASARPLRLRGCLHRERYQDPDRREWFDSGGDREPLPATPEHDVCIPIREDASGRYVGLRCPDCDSDRIAWAEAGGVPGSRECADCGSRLTDSRYGVLIHDAPCMIRAAYRLLIEDPGCGEPHPADGTTIADHRLAVIARQAPGNDPHRPALWSAAERAAAVRLARERLASDPAMDPAMRRSLREALALSGATEACEPNENYDSEKEATIPPCTTQN
ncbi:hypothetical protein [Candidatus Poriferisodalis sp.]|uniref:hypothetical protein n=1 Tax=Candidatus Poriferisodalis sp. TaxID=3101277 RepID=UPI003B01ACC8